MKTTQMSATQVSARPIHTVLGILIALSLAVGPAVAQPARSAAEERAYKELNALYKGDYRAAFVQKKPELFLKHIDPGFTSTSIEGFDFDATKLREFFTAMFTTMVRTIEHNVTIEDVDVAANGEITAVVTLYTLIEFKGRKGGTYFVTTVGTYRDTFVRTPGGLIEVRAQQLRNQTTTAPRP